MSRKELRGIYAPITTPFDRDGTLNLAHLKENVKRYADSFLDGYLVLGSNGENKSLTTQEKEQVVRTVLENKSPKQMVAVGCIFESTMETVDFARRAEEMGADFIALLPPCYFKKAMNDDVLYQYFTDVASAVKTPCVLYKAPQFSGGVDLSLSLIQKCAAHPNIVGIKDSSSSGIEKILHTVPQEFHVMSGSANTLFSAMINGATGGVISLADSLPDVVTRLYSYLESGDLGKAAELNHTIVSANLDISGKYGVAGVKCAMDFCGLHGDYPRLPLLPLSERERSSIQAVLQTTGWTNENGCHG